MAFGETDWTWLNPPRQWTAGAYAEQYDQAGVEYVDGGYHLSTVPAAPACG
ncbi:hypothetical protein [Nonomuraea maritima]|uniref:hypothetical protein n=1 Tax=Nonomuraea maritima TaxID=683260 RepID=UPI00371530B2